MSKNDASTSGEAFTSKLSDDVYVEVGNGGVSSHLRMQEVQENGNDPNGRPQNYPKGKAEIEQLYRSKVDKLKEIKDDKWNFVRLPSTDISTYPSRKEVKSKLKQLHGTFSVKKGFEKIILLDGLFYYFISSNYTKKLCEWLGSKSNTNIPDLTVDNSSLVVSNDSFVQRNIDTFSHVISEECWNQLVQWFGGGVSIRMKCIRQRTNSGKLFRVTCGNDTSHFRRFFFNTNETIYNAKKYICEVFGVKSSLTRLHDFHKGKLSNRIDTSGSVALARAGLTHNNLCFLEVKKEDEEFGIIYRSKPSYIDNYYSSDDAYARNFRSGYRQQNTNYHFQPIDTISGNRSSRGIVGLNNLGNTCYMNSILQCLSNTFLVKEAFLSKSYENDINGTNVLGYQGKVAKAFYNVLRLLWSGDGSSVRPAAFKKAITEAKAEFKGYRQHDSQEFLSQLLDALHEDLNRVVDKPGTQNIEANGRPDVIVAEESFANYKLRNNSIITDLFTGLLKSTVTCPEQGCGNVSVTFDPYMILPLPLEGSHSSYQVIQLVFVPRSPELKPCQTEVIVPKHGPLYLLRESIKERLGINKLNEQEIQTLKKKNKFKISNNQDVSVALGYSENDKEVVGKRDILLFSVQKSCLNPIPLSNTAELGDLSADLTLVCYEVIDYSSFEHKLFQPELDWRRELNFPRLESNETENNESEDECKLSNGERYNIGFVDCPFLINDVWLGRYNHNSDQQDLRIEILAVDTMDWAAYSNYKAEVMSKYGEHGIDVQLTEEEFAQSQVFFIQAQADSKESSEKPKISFNESETQFELKGVYIKKELTKPDVHQMDIYDTANGMKVGDKNKNLNSKPSTKNANSIKNLHVIAKNLSPGILEDKYLHGAFVLRPTKNREIYRPQLYYSGEDTSREPMILHGSIEPHFKLMWGHFQVEFSSVKGQFICQRYESMNWNSRKEPVQQGEVRNYTVLPKPLNNDPRILVLLAHKVMGEHGYGRHAGIPDAFFVPARITESELMDMLKARFRIYFEGEFKLTGAKPAKFDNENETNIDEIDQRLKSLVVKRGTKKFETSEYASRTVGCLINPQEDREANSSNENILFLVCEWTDYPFLEQRSEHLFSLERTSSETKMTLHNALDLFQQTDRLNQMNSWYCSKCKDHRQAFKQLQLWSVPKVLVIQFKRFSQNETRMKADKLETPVQFPFEIDLAHYTLCSKVAGNSVQADVEAATKELDYNYELVAISSHIGGGLGSGHYVACAKNENDGQWYSFDDSRVSKIPESNILEIVNPQAYVLFYVRKSELEARKVVLDKRRLEAPVEPVSIVPQDEIPMPMPQPLGTNQSISSASNINQHHFQETSLEVENEESSHKSIDENKLTEIIDRKGHFCVLPSKDSGSYPTREEVLRKLTELHQMFSKRSGFKAMRLDKGSTYYLIGLKYVGKLCKWIQDKKVSDLTVDNSSLCKFSSGNLLREKLDPSRDYQIVSEECWEQLIQWFGGGASIKIRCLGRKIETKKLIKVVCSNDIQRFRRFYFNGDETIAFVKNEVCNSFGVDPESARLHDFFKGKPYSRLDEPDNLQTPLRKRKLLFDNLCYLELRNEKNLFTIQYSNRRQAGKTFNKPYSGSNRSYASGMDVVQGTRHRGRGLLGLKKSDNISYCNSIIQCLSNTEFFKRFFMSGAFQPDINRTNPIGHNGEVAMAFHNVLKLLWGQRGEFVNPARFEATLQKAYLVPTNPHDFLSRLIDAIHEDLNRITKKPPTEKVEGNGKPDAVAAAESLKVYKMRNYSIVTDLFTGLLKTKITCLERGCGNMSITFDPYVVLRLPLGESQMMQQVVEVVFVPGNPEHQPRRIQVMIAKNSPMFLLRERLKQKLFIGGDARKLHEQQQQIQSEKESLLSTGLKIAEKRDLMIFNSTGNHLGPVFLDSTEDVGEVLKTGQLICYETLDFTTFEQFCFTPNSQFNKNFQYPRNDGNDNNFQVPENEQKQIGYQSCPFLLADVWHGQYRHKSKKIDLRIEVTGVEVMAWDKYKSYKDEIINRYGFQCRDSHLNQKGFEAVEVFLVTAKANSIRSNRGSSQLVAFELRGVYITQIEEEIELMGKSGIDGHFVLRPTPTQMSNNSYRTKPKHMIILEGTVDTRNKYMWGKYQISESDDTGSFACRRHESMNWQNQLIASPDRVVKNSTRFPTKLLTDNRLLVLLCYKNSEKFRDSYFGVPDAFFVPAQVTEAELMKIIRARFRVYFELEFKLTGANNDIISKDGNEEKLDHIEERVRELTIKKATTFSKRLHVLDSNGKQIVSNEPVVHLVCETFFYPFFESRPENVLTSKAELDKTSTNLENSLIMLSQPRTHNTWYCNKCKNHKDALKQQEIWSMPSILIIQFNRYPGSEDVNVTNNSYNDLPVKFPFDVDFTSYTLRSKAQAKSLQASVESMDKKLDMKYELYAITSYKMLRRNAHYVAYTKNIEQGCWYRYDNEAVSKVSLKDIHAPLAYNLFYIKKSEVKHLLPFE